MKIIWGIAAIISVCGAHPHIGLGVFFIILTIITD